MAGYAARVGGSEGLLDELTASCLALEANGERFLLIALDLIGVDPSMVDELAARLDMPPASIAISASHTHSGPAGVLKRLHPAEEERVDARLRSEVMRAAERAARTALETRVDVAVTFSRAAVEGVAANRNVPDGPFDSRVSAIRVRTPAGDPVATVVHFACHPTILPASSRMISAEFPGAMRRYLPASEFGAVLFANGAAGDVSTRFTRCAQDVIEVERVGRAIANAVRGDSAMIPLAPSITSRRFDATIRLRDRSDVDGAGDLALRATKALERDDLPPAQRRIEETRLQGAEILQRMAERFDAMPDRIPVSVWTLGELTLVGFPGELFASLGMELTQVREPALVFGYTNGYFGYFPDRAAYESGTYEALASPFAPGASEEVIASLRERI
jgi:hypothetical protein